MYRLLAALRTALALATVLVALDTGALARVGGWVVQQAQAQQPSCCAQVPSTTPGADALVEHVEQIDAVVRWAGSWAGLDLPTA